MNSSMYRNLTITALLMALAIMIPIMMPLRSLSFPDFVYIVNQQLTYSQAVYFLSH